MTRLLSIVALLGALLAPVAIQQPALALDKPNVVVIMTDDQTLEQLRVMPNTLALIGAAGTTYDNFVTSLALCCPSRATFLTGQYAHNHGVLSNAPPNGGDELFNDATALPVWLQNAGYRTVHIGKYLNGFTEADTIPAGWSDWQAMIPPSYYSYKIDDNGTLVSYGASAADYSTDVLVGRAEQAIAESAPGGPFFLNLALFAPHTDKVVGSTLRTAIPAPRHEGAFASEPLPKPPNFNEAVVTDKPAHIKALRLLSTAAINEITTRYRDELESLLAVDEAVARVIDALSAAGELDNTVVMFVSDNGFFHGEHRIKSAKAQPYEEAIHVPLLIRGPGFVAGAHVAHLGSNIDLAPTIAAIAGAAPLVWMDGIDLRGLYAGRSVVIETYDGNCFTGLRTATETYVRYYTGEEELYDLVADPYQLTSQHANPAYAARLATLRAQLDVVEPNPLPACAGR